MTNIIISSCNETLKENIEAILELNRELYPVTCFNECDDIFTKLELLNPQFIVVDLMENYREGLWLIQKIKKLSTGIKIIAVTHSNDQHIMIDAFKCGINGYLVIEGLFSELYRCLCTILLGELYVSHRIINTIVKSLIKTPKDKLSGFYLLSTKEIDHLRYIANGKYSKEIAMIMNISKKTADNYRSRIMRKLELNSIADVVKYALREQIIQL